MKKLFSLILVLFILSSCEKNSSETNELLLDSENIINKLEKADLEKLLGFFDVESISDLTSTEMKSSLKSDYSIVVVYDEQFEDNPELADKVVYLEISNEVAYVLNVLERTNRDDISRIEISKTFDQYPIFIIEFDIDQEYSNFISLKSFDDCLDNCIYWALDNIFNHGSWVRRAAFIYSAAIQFAIIVADCTFQCL